MNMKKKQQLYKDISFHSMYYNLSFLPSIMNETRPLMNNIFRKKRRQRRHIQKRRESKEIRFLIWSWRNLINFFWLSINSLSKSKEYICSISCFWTNIWKANEWYLACREVQRCLVLNYVWYWIKLFLTLKKLQVCY